ncbi:MAG TPA: Lrp/AsnC family transcriptional regulator [Candidatus Acidoferrales bacterium]|nr:Lrp/AsnC family transcriptional regulator [Candidatus Acidoferrales bacterium]
MNNIKIDKTDATIIQMLLKESRTSFTDIAKECKITVGAVRMRYKRLLKEGVINGEVTLVNPHCLGYRHIVDLGIMTDPENEQEVAKYLEDKPLIGQLVPHLGKYNFFAKVALSDLNKLSAIVEDLESNPKIKHVDTLIWAEAVNVEFPTNIIIKPLPPSNIKHQRPTLTNIDQAPLELDEIDRKIAIIVATKARTPFRHIAEELGISTKTVIQRYRKLREKLLVRSTVTVDLNKLGYRAMADLYIKVVNRSKLTEIYAQLLQIPNVIVVLRLLGDYDLYVAVALEDFSKMFEVTERISKIAGIEKPFFFLTPMIPVWPLNLFAALLETNVMPKYYWNGIDPKHPPPNFSQN